MAIQVAILAPSVQGIIVALALAALVYQLWTVRLRMNQHLDMLLLMTAYGGLGMLLTAPTCHSPFSVMTAGMLAAGLPPTVYGARCIRQSAHPVLLTILDTAVMTAAMALVHFLLATHDRALHHA